MTKPEIVTVLQREGVGLHQRGRRLWVCCPFHSERTPSFFVDMERQRFKCFGCHASGDAIDFIMKYKELSFREALQYLGISGGNSRPDRPSPDELRRLELVRRFREWCSNYIKWLGEKLRLCNRIDSILKSPDDLGLKGLSEMYLLRDVYRYYLSILNSEESESKFELYKEGRHEGRF